MNFKFIRNFFSFLHYFFLFQSQIVFLSYVTHLKSLCPMQMSMFINTDANMVFFKNVLGIPQKSFGPNPTGMTHNLLSLFMQTGRSIYLSCLFHYFSAFCFSFFSQPAPRAYTLRISCGSGAEILGLPGTAV